MRYATLVMSAGILGALSLISVNISECCSSSNPDADSDGFCENSDCDDTNDAVYPGATETCDQADNDCDGYVDDQDPDVTGEPTWYQDVDGDGYGVANVTTVGCSRPQGYAAKAGDCGPSDNTVYPGAPELCDDKDNDCNGSLSANELDADGDGFSVCDKDCDDADAATYPNAPEACDERDNSCDGQLPASERDDDQDGYTGCDGDCNLTDATVNPGAVEVCDTIDQDCDGLADVSTDGNTGWQRSVCGAVLKGTSGTYDSVGIDQINVIYNANANRYDAWYRTTDSSKVQRIGYAQSTNGIQWTKNSTPVLSPGASSAWDAKALAFPSVLIEGGQYTMWYHAQDTANKIRIGRAISTNGITWTKSPTTWVLEPTPSTWDSVGTSAPSVMYDADKKLYKMWYTGSDNTSLRTGYATSPDGIVWTKHPTWVLNVGGTGDWDSRRAVFTRVQKDQGFYRAYYSGDDVANTYTYELGYAYSTDGIAWTKAADPILSPVPGGFDAFMTYGADVVKGPDGYSMYYSGAPAFDGPYSVGLARNAEPYANLLMPADGDQYRQGEPVEFVIDVDDLGYGQTLAAHFVSELQGLVGEATAYPGQPLVFSTRDLEPGTHVVHALIFDRGGLFQSQSVELVIQ